MRIVILSVGRLRPPFVDDVRHYHKLLSRHARVELVEVREGERVARRIPNGAFVVQLDAAGRALDSEGLSEFIAERRLSRRDLCFLVGGPHGLDLGTSDMRLSLGPMTLPHQLARVVLLEQLYRAHKILAGEPYHYSSGAR